MAPGAYDPDVLLMPLANELEQVGIEALHVFTFNQVAATEAWRQLVINEEGVS